MNAESLRGPNRLLTQFGFYFEAFLSLLFPSIHEQIDWSRGYEYSGRRCDSCRRTFAAETPRPAPPVLRRESAPSKWIAGNFYEHLHDAAMANVGILNLDEYGEIGKGGHRMANLRIVLR